MGPVKIELIAGIVGLAIGIFCAASPERAATIWSADQLRRLPQQSRMMFLTCYRAFGIVFALACVLFCVKIIIG
jgi:hypothetical protein